MGLFTRSVKSARSTYQPDPIIMITARMAEEAMMDCFTQQAAFWAAHRRKKAEQLDREYPGYREELNRQRAAVDLPPI